MNTDRNLKKTDPLRLRGVATVAAGVLIISFDALLVRLAGVNGWDVAFWRGVFMALSLGLVLRLRPTLAGGGSRQGLWLAAATMTASTLTLVLAFTLTRAANAVVILSLAPLFAAVTSRVFLGERNPLRTWVAIAVCIGGVLWVTSGSLGHGHLAGDLLAIVSTFFIGAYFTLFRRYPELSRMRVVSLSGVLLVLASLPLATPFILPAESYGWLALSGVLQMPLALVLLTGGTRFLPAAEVSLFLLLETILAPVWVWLVLGEVPPRTTFLGGLLILSTLILHTWVGYRFGKPSSDGAD